MAERQGFEPWVGLHPQRFSRPPRSTTPAPVLSYRLLITFFRHLNRVSCIQKTLKVTVTMPMNNRWQEKDPTTKISTTFRRVNEWPNQLRWAVCACAPWRAIPQRKSQRTIYQSSSRSSGACRALERLLESHSSSLATWHLVRIVKSLIGRCWYRSASTSITTCT